MIRNATQLALALILVAAAAAPADAQGRKARGHWGASGALRAQVGVFQPAGDSQYWTDKELDFFSSPSDFEEESFGIEYIKFLGPRFGLLLSGTFYEARNTTSYRDFVDEVGNEILHDTELDTASFTVGLVYRFTGRDAVISPYVGAGAGLYFWRLTESGDFIDFDFDNEIFFGDFLDEEDTFGYYLQAGIDVPVAPSWSVYGEARWQDVDEDLGGPFRGLGTLDLSGVTYAVGVAWSF